jgi:hypothetical protein
MAVFRQLDREQPKFLIARQNEAARAADAAAWVMRAVVAPRR